MFQRSQMSFLIRREYVCKHMVPLSYFEETKQVFDFRNEIQDCETCGLEIVNIRGYWIPQVGFI